MKLAYGVNGMLGGLGREAIDPSKILELSVQRFYRTSGGAKRNEAWNLLDDLTVGYNTARVQAKRAIEQGQPEAADALIKEWNSKAESVIPDITNIIAEDDPEEAKKISQKVTFQSGDIARLKKTVQEEIAEIKKTPTATPKEGYWGTESAPATMEKMLSAQPVAGYWK
jgi:D-alanyl-D-alanine carboxypeptidase